MPPRPVDPSKFPPFVQVLVWFADEAKDVFLGGMDRLVALAATKGGFFLCLGFFLLSVSATGLTAFSITRGENGSFDIKTGIKEDPKAFLSLPEPDAQLALPESDGLVPALED